MKDKDIILPFFELRILSVGAAEDLVENDSLDKWNVVSLWAPVWDWEGSWDKGKWINDRPSFPKAKRLCQHKFHDADVEEKDIILCTEKHISDILEFSENCIGESLLVHCHAGLSRSPAISFLILLNSIKNKVENPAETAMRIVVKIRPATLPNRHILNVGIPLIAKDEDTQIRWFRELYNSRTFGN